MRRRHVAGVCAIAALVAIAALADPASADDAAAAKASDQAKEKPKGNDAAGKPEKPAQADNGTEDKAPDNPAKAPDQAKEKSKDDNGAEKPEKPAQADSGAEDKAPDNPAKAPDKQSSDKSDDFWTRKTLLGDIGEIRPFLAKYGMTLGIIDTNEALGNVTGGKQQGAIYDGLTDLTFGIDLRPTLDVRGNVYARAYQIRGRGLTPSIGNVNEISGIEAMATTRLAEFWYEQHYDKWRIRIGEQTVTTNFLNPATTRMFVSGALGWPTLPAIVLPTGGPGYPLGTPAVRVRFDPVEGLTLFSAVFNGDPTGAGVGGSQLADASGTAFRVGDGAFVINELRYNPDSSDDNGTYRIGGWYNSERFRDLHLDINGLSLAGALNNGRARPHGGDYSLYAIVDQPFLIDKEAKTAFAAFARAMGAPGDRNLVELYVDAGLVYKGPLGRPDDQLGFAVAYARIGSAARALDADTARLAGSSYPIRSGETALELTYRFQLAGWWQLQPDFQYVFNPGGGIPNPNAPGHRVGDAAIFGLRNTITF